MKIHTEPNVYLVGMMTDMAPGIDQFLVDREVQWTTDALSAAEYLTELSGRLCYSSYKNPRPGGNTAYIDRIKEQAHGEVLEHAVYAFIVTGISRSCSQQVTRYRTFSFCQRSSRFCDEDEIGFVCPPIHLKGWEMHESDNIFSPNEVNRLERQAYRHWLQSCEESLEHYQTQILLLEKKGHSRKEVRETARAVLPQCVATELYFTANARALRHAIEQRCHEGADVEVRRLFNKILDLLQGVSPALFGDYERESLKDGTFAVKTECPRKV